MSDDGSTNETVTVPVGLGPRHYDILIGNGLRHQAGQRIAGLLRRPRTVFVTDETVNELYGDDLAAALEAAGIRHSRIVLPVGESSKDFKHLENLLDQLLEAEVERQDTILAFGGGVIGDLTGFAASIFRRGVDCIQVPTTLLAQVDSAVGGKTGINTRHGKNLIGAFHQPRLVISDIGTLASLPPREFRAGFAEIVKYALIGDAGFFGWLEENHGAVLGGDEPALRHAIEVSCRAKARVVEADEKEAGSRALLNLGHTFGHALEAAIGYEGGLLHGEAVALGTIMAFELSERLGRCPADEVAKVRALFEASGLPTGAPALEDVGGAPPVEDLVRLMLQDKKVKDSRPAFVLAAGIGQAFITQDVDPDLLGSVISDCLAP